jgi:hypothetical protein
LEIANIVTFGKKLKKEMIFLFTTKIVIIAPTEY